VDPGLQCSWLDGDVVAWQPGRGVYGGNLSEQVGKLVPGRRWQMAFAPGTVRVVPMELPSGRQQVMCQRLDLMALDAIADTHLHHGDASPSIVWFAGLYREIRSLVRAGRVLPHLAPVDDGWWRSAWQPIATDVPLLVDAWRPVMPPAVGAAQPVEVATIVAALTDELARLTLNTRGWRPETDARRNDTARAMRTVMRSLGQLAGRFEVAPELDGATQAVARHFEQIAARAAGRPIVHARLRLGLPDEHDEPLVGAWPLALDVVDSDDPGVWCTASSVRSADTAALTVAGGAEHLVTLHALLDQAEAHLGVVTPFLSSWLDDRGGGVSIDDAAALLESVDLLDAGGVELLAPQRLTRRKVASRATVSTATNSSGLLGAPAILQWQPVIDDAVVSEDALRRAAESSSSLIEIGGRWVQVDRAEARRALANLAEHRARHAELSPLELLRLAAAFEDDEQEDTGDNLVVGDDIHGWATDLLAGLPDDRLTDAEPPPAFAATLRPYQRRGLGWLQFLHRLGLGGCLADDMGLGKTPTTLAHLSGLPGPHLVICPLSVVRNWEAEASRFTPLMRVMVHHGTGRASAEQFGMRVAQHDLVITTYHTIVRDIAAVVATAWSIVVFDEAQAVKNADTATARAARRIPAGQRIALTGTPVENRLSELWSILHTVTPGLLGSAAQFKQRFSDPIERERSATATAALRRLTGPFLLRRTKADKSLVPDLPDKVEQLAWASLTREQATMYQQVVDQLLRDAQQESGMRRRGLVLAALTRLKQICNHPAHALGDGSRLAGRSGKLARFDELVIDLVDAGQQALVFTQFREMGLLLQQHLHERFQLTTPFLHGGVTKRSRDRMVDDFQSGAATSPLLLVSLKAGGTGLNLTAASRVVHYDRWWNPAVEDQATDRAWRIGQKQSVFVHKLVCEGTVEERVDQLINDKRALADAVVGGAGEAWLSELSTDALRDLVRLDPQAVRA
jgi:hypothetical protein